MRGSFALTFLTLISAALAMHYHDVQVGANGLTFTPEYVHGYVGDVVRFTFSPKAHSVTQSNFETPCIFNGHLDTGLLPVNADAAARGWKPTIDVPITDDKPQWFYCRQMGHCGQGMVFAINPPPEGNERSFSEFKKLAIQRNGTAAATHAAPTATSGHPWEVTPSPVTHDVQVGESGLVFSPESITANVGDIVKFTFNPKAHSVTQSNFDAPCVFNGLFDTGLTPVSPDDVAKGWRPTAEFHVTVSTPLWFYCKQTGHCGQGMVFAINAPAEGGDKSFSAFKQLAVQQNGTAVATSTAPAPSSDTTTRCPASDDDGSALLDATFEEVGKLTTCRYEKARACVYFADGSFSQGASNCPNSLDSSSGNVGGNVNTLAGSLSDGDDEESVDVKTLIRNSYIAIGLLGAVLLGFISLVLILAFGRKGLKGREVKYSKLAELKGFTMPAEHVDVRYSDRVD